MAPITRDDLVEMAADLKSYIRERDEDADKRNVERFGAVNDRLDKVNGNIARHEQEIGKAAADRARIDQAVTNLDRQVFRRGQTSDREAFDLRQRVATHERGAIATGSVDDDQPAITRGGVKRAAALVTAAGLAVEGLHRLAPYVAALFAGVK